MTAQLVTAEDVAIWLGLPIPLTANVSARIDKQVMASQGKVEAFLNRSLGAYEDTITQLIPDDSWPLTDDRAWRGAVGNYYDDKWAVKSYVANTQTPGTYDVTFTVGLDVANDSQYQPILAWIEQDAANALHGDSLFTAITRPVESVSADGQSVTYEHHRGFPAPTSSGAAPDIKSLKKWKRYAIAQQPSRRLAPWPYAYRNW